MQLPAFQHMGPPPNLITQHHTGPIANGFGIPLATAAGAPQNQAPRHLTSVLDYEVLFRYIRDSEVNDTDSDE
jgi:hypothetical protein